MQAKKDFDACVAVAAHYGEGLITALEFRNNLLMTIMDMEDEDELSRLARNLINWQKAE